jgi:ribonuclease-3 family protein
MISIVNEAKEGPVMTDYFNVRLPDDEIRAISSIGLAHLGDGVYELLVRAWLCAHGRATGKGLHRAAVELVKAPAQAERAERILPLLTEEEAAVYKRGRNAHVHTVPHSASRADYLKATALECLLGDLYLRGRRERINELFTIMMEEEHDAS